MDSDNCKFILLVHFRNEKKKPTHSNNMIAKSGGFEQGKLVMC